MSVQTQAQSKFITINGIKLHYLDYPGGEPTIMLTHGLTANAWSLDPLARKLSPTFHVVVFDTRGRGLSDKPATGYRMSDLSGDYLGLMDAFGIQKGIIGGHSAGAFVTMYIAANYPERVSKLLILESGLTNPRALELLGPSLSRLGKIWASWDEYFKVVKESPELHGWWDPDIEDYYRADVQTNPDGTVVRRSTPEVITQVLAGQAEMNLPELLGKVKQPTLLVNAPGPLGPGDTPALIPVEQAKMTASMIANCRYVAVAGNHYTMLYQPGVQQVADAIKDFARNG